MHSLAAQPKSKPKPSVCWYSLSGKLMLRTLFDGLVFLLNKDICKHYLNILKIDLLPIFSFPIHNISNQKYPFVIVKRQLSIAN